MPNATPIIANTCDGLETCLRVLARTPEDAAIVIGTKEVCRFTEYLRGQIGLRYIWAERIAAKELAEQQAERLSLTLPKGYTLAPAQWLGDWPTEAITYRGDDFAVISCLFNPGGFESRTRNYFEWREGMEKSGVPVFVAELLFADAEPVIGNADLRLSTHTILWHKERLLNLIAAVVPKQFSKLAFIDCDMIWPRHDWWKEASALLERVPAVQLFSRVDDEGKDGGIEMSRPGIVANGGKSGRPGGAWAVHRELFTHYGGLYDRMVAGGGDCIHTAAFLGDANPDFLRQCNDVVKASARAWLQPACRYFRGQTECLPDAVKHLWHGEWADRKYGSRMAAIQHFDPDADIEADAHNVYSWADGAPVQMVEEMAAYFAGRKEDGNGND